MRGWWRVTHSGLLDVCGGSAVVIDAAHDPLRPSSPLLNHTAATRRIRRGSRCCRES